MANKNIDGDVNVQFTEESSRQSLESGESVKTLFGKLRKWLSDLKPVAFSGSYNDLDNKPSIPSAVAVKGNAESTYRTGNVNLTPANIGLGNVNNTSDVNKPISTAAQAALDAQQAQINYNTNQGVKNLLITDKSKSVSSNGMTFTANGDGTFTINGTNISSNTLIAANISDLSLGMNAQVSKKTISSNKVKFYAIGLPNTMRFQLAKNTTMSITGITVNDIRGSAVSNVVDITNYDYVWFRFVVDANASFDNVVIKPMVVDASVEDTSDFVPYAMSNVELMQKFEDISDCLYINAYNAGSAITIQNTSDFTIDAYAKYFVIDVKPKFAFLKLSSQSATQYLRAMINVKTASSKTSIDVAFTDGITLYEFYWNWQAGTLETPTITAKTLSFA